MRAAKIACAVTCVFSLMGFIGIIRGIHSPQTVSLFTGHGILAAIGLIALMCAVEFYGIHTKALFAWKLGWGILAAILKPSTPRIRLFTKVTVPWNNRHNLFGA